MKGCICHYTKWQIQLLYLRGRYNLYTSPNCVIDVNKWESFLILFVPVQQFNIMYPPRMHVFVVGNNCYQDIFRSADPKWSCFLCRHPANTRHWPRVWWMLAPRLRRWPNIDPTLGQTFQISHRLLFLVKTTSLEPLNQITYLCLAIKIPNKKVVLRKLWI